MMHSTLFGRRKLVGTLAWVAWAACVVSRGAACDAGPPALRCGHDAARSGHCSFNNQTCRFRVSGNTEIVIKIDDKLVEITCINAPRFDCSSLPSFSKNPYKSLGLKQCMPNCSFVQVMERLNISTGVLQVIRPTDSKHFNVTIPPQLQSFNLRSPNSLLTITMELFDTYNLNELRISSWSTTKPTPLKWCGVLKIFELQDPAMEVLPPGWLKNCTGLENLILNCAKNLKELPPTMFGSNTNALSNLTSLRIADCHLESLPEDLFRHTPNLKMLDLRGNHFTTISSVMMQNLRALTMLDVSNNKRLGDLCSSSSDSPFLNLTNLDKLSLEGNNGTTRICPDWRLNLTSLTMLNLRKTSISELQDYDLHIIRLRTKKARVCLGRKSSFRFNFTKEDFDKINLIATGAATIELHVKNIECDCEKYWTRRVLDKIIEKNNSKRSGITIECKGNKGRDLMKMSTEDMRCDAPKVCTEIESGERGIKCTCHNYATGGSSDGGLSVDCSNGGLTKGPALPAALSYKLELQDNIINQLRLPSGVTTLNLTNNSLVEVDEETALKLATVETLHFKHNPLACDCRVEPLRNALPFRLLSNVTCWDGRPLREVSVVHCAAERLQPWVAGGATSFVLLAAAAALAYLAYLSRPGWRLWFHTCVYKAGLWRRAREAAVCRYDAVILYDFEPAENEDGPGESEDRAVASEIVRRLESEPEPYRLCDPRRDFERGRFAPDEIRAAVAQSRRTVVIASRAFLGSRWANTEYRAAYEHAMSGARPRLVVVLLEERSALALGGMLARYVAWNTYVRWGDTWFWDKMHVTLGRPVTCAVDDPPPGPAAFAVPAAHLARVADSNAAPTETILLLDSEPIVHHY